MQNYLAGRAALKTAMRLMDEEGDTLLAALIVDPLLIMEGRIRDRRAIAIAKRAGDSPQDGHAAPPPMPGNRMDGTPAPRSPGNRL